jgi:hypothetical protein
MQIKPMVRINAMALAKVGACRICSVMSFGPLLSRTFWDQYRPLAAILPASNPGTLSISHTLQPPRANCRISDREFDNAPDRLRCREGGLLLRNKRGANIYKINRLAKPPLAQSIPSLAPVALLWTESLWAAYKPTTISSSPRNVAIDQDSPIMYSGLVQKNPINCCQG